MYVFVVIEYDIPPVVTQMNIIRSELNAQGGNYGQRLDYGATSVGSYNYIPFDISAQNQLSFGFYLYLLINF